VHLNTVWQANSRLRGRESPCETWRTHCCVAKDSHVLGYDTFFERVFFDFSMDYSASTCRNRYSSRTA